MSKIIKQQFDDLKLKFRNIPDDKELDQILVIDHLAASLSNLVSTKMCIISKIT